MWSNAAAKAWWALVERGQVWTPEQCSGDAALALEYAVREGECRRKGPNNATPRPHLMVNTQGGDSSCWRIAKLISRDVWDCTVDNHGISAGLILTVACRGTRTCTPSSEFAFHGEQRRDYELPDQRRAEWFAERTNMPIDFWLGHIGKPRAFYFDAQEALEMGVVSEILDCDTSNQVPGL